MIARILRSYREHQARAREAAREADVHRRLTELVTQTANSDVIKQYRKYRAAAKKGMALKREKSLG